jgi:hypothetical protein
LISADAQVSLNALDPDLVAHEQGASRRRVRRREPGPRARGDLGSTQKTLGDAEAGLVGHAASQTVRRALDDLRRRELRARSGSPEQLAAALPALAISAAMIKEFIDDGVDQLGFRSRTGIDQSLEGSYARAAVLEVVFSRRS